MVLLGFLLINIPLDPQNKSISELKAGEYVKTLGIVYYIDYIHEKETYKIKICKNDEYENYCSGKNIDYQNSLIIYPENNLLKNGDNNNNNNNKDLMYNRYIYNLNISKGDKLEVIGKITEYMGYKIMYLKEASDLTIVSKSNIKTIENADNQNNMTRAILNENKTEYNLSLVYISLKSSSKVYHTLDNCPYGSRITNKTYVNISEINDTYEICSYCKSHLVD
ncbi:hypothetical protein [Methanococcus voltae]|nr:hypothetical protein [Methanococcus voltae]MCS3900562.1 hypothetical protein [Methanococcus voltae]